MLLLIVKGHYSTVTGANEKQNNNNNHNRPPLNYQHHIVSDSKTTFGCSDAPFQFFFLTSLQHIHEGRYHEKLILTLQENSIETVSNFFFAKARNSGLKAYMIISVVVVNLHSEIS